MATLSDLVSRVRFELADTPQKFRKVFTGDGVGVDFALGVKPVDKTTLSVTVNDSNKAQPSEYTVEDKLGVIHFTTPPPANSKVVVSGSAFRYFTDEDITYYVNTSLTQHTENRTDGFGRKMNLGILPLVEEYPLVILSTIEALWALATDAAFDINIVAPDGVSIPRSQRYEQLTKIIGDRWDQYRQLCSALNVGLWRIEMGTLRRVSRTTNKLIPIYMAQEIDDSRQPERIYLQNDLLGRNPMPEYSGVYDIQIYQGDSWSQQFIFPFDVSNLTFKAQIRTYPNAPAIYASFDIAKTNPADGVITLSLSKSATAYLPVRAFWDLQATDFANTNFEQTYIKGQVFVQQQVTLD